MIAASAPIDRIDIAFIICFLVHKEPGVYRVALSEANRNQDPASCPGDFSPMRLGAANTATNSTGRRQRFSLNYAASGSYSGAAPFCSTGLDVPRPCAWPR